MRLALTVTLLVDELELSDDQVYVEAMADAVGEVLSLAAARARFRSVNGEPSTLALVRNVVSVEPGLLLD